MNAHLSWSQRLAQRYCLELSDVLADWLDEGVWKHLGIGEFHRPVSPPELVAATPQPVWPALMECNLLPLLGNNAGDYLCARVDSTGNDAEIVHWYHGGGDWVPWGKNLAEAILFDAIVEYLPGPQREHAIAAEDRRPYRSRGIESDSLIAWATGWLPREVASLLKNPHQFGDQIDRCPERLDSLPLVAALIQHDVCHEATRLALVEASLAGNNETRFSQAQRFVSDVLDRRQDLAWCHHVAAIVEQSRGRLDHTVEHYLSAIHCSNFTDQSVRLQHTWDHHTAAKWSVAQLQQLGFFATAKFDDLHRDDRDLLSLMTETSTRRAVQITEHWLKRAAQQEQDGQFARAQQFAIRAGWDVGATTMETYQSILVQIQRCAAVAGHAAQATIAQTHLDCLRQRYRLAN